MSEKPKNQATMDRHSTPIPSPNDLLLEMLAKFGLADPQDIRSWPFAEEGDHRRGINRLVAKFTCAGQCFLMKARTVEHRGTKALFETQNIQKDFHKYGVRVPALYSAPNGETLIPGPDPRNTSGVHYEVQRYLLGPRFYDVPAIYYEIQHYIPGQRPSADESTCYRIGAALALFHATGHQPEVRSLDPAERDLAAVHIDTHLLNKSMYISDFIKRRFVRLKEIHAYVRELETISPAEQRTLNDMFNRMGDLSWKSTLSWGIIHGDFCANNVLVSNGGIFIIDFDEVGLGPISDDIGDLFGDLEQAGPQKVHALLRGYLENEGSLSEVDRIAIIDGLVLQQLATAFENGHRELEIDRLFAEYWELFWRSEYPSLSQ